MQNIKGKLNISNYAKAQFKIAFPNICIKFQRKKQNVVKEFTFSKLLALIFTKKIPLQVIF